MSRICTSGTKLPTTAVAGIAMIDRADLEALEHLALAAQRTPGMQPDLEAAIASLLDLLGEGRARLCPREKSGVRRSRG